MSAFMLGWFGVLAIWFAWLEVYAWRKGRERRRRWDAFVASLERNRQHAPKPFREAP